MDFPDVDSDPDLRGVTLGAAMGLQTPLDVHSALDGVAGGIEGHKKPVPGVVDLVALVLDEAPPHFSVQPGTQIKPGRIADRLDQARRAGQVREHQCLASTNRTRLGRQRGSKLLS